MWIETRDAAAKTKEMRETFGKLSDEVTKGKAKIHAVFLSPYWQFFVPMKTF